jgi:hypothetical protein
MALSKLGIYNLALSRVGTRSSVSDVDENSEEAARIRAVYSHVRDMVLADHEWGFATIYKALAESGETDSLWIYQYRYPADCLNFIAVQTQSWLSGVDADGAIFDYSSSMMSARYREVPSVPFEIGLNVEKTQKVILTNEPDAVGKYVVSVANEALFDSLFADCFAWKLAQEVAPSLTGSTGMVTALGNAYQGALLAAKAKNNDEGQPKQPRDPSSVRARI